MKKKWLMLVAGLLALTLAIGACAPGGGGGGGGAASGAAADAEVDWDDTYEFTVALVWGYTQLDSEIQQYFEEKYNVRLNIIIMPSGGDLQPRINLLMADETQRPCTFSWTTGNMMREFVQWRDAGLLVDLAPYYWKYPYIREYYEAVAPDALFYRAEPDGRLYAVPSDVGEPGHMVTLLRKDWLDHLGLPVPTTFDGYFDALRAMTLDNPMGSHANGFFGFAGPMEFRSLKPFFTYYESIPDQWILLDDGSIGHGAVQPGTREALEFIASMYSDNVIDPRILTRDLNFGEMFVQGTFGSCYRWIAWFNPSDGSHIAFLENNPGGEYIPFWMPPNNRGTESEHYWPARDWTSFSITTRAENPERIYHFLDILTRPDNYLIARYGFEGIHYTYEDGILDNLLTEEDNLANNIGRGFLGSFAPNRKDEWNISNIPEVNAMFERASTIGVANDKARIAFIKEPDRPIWNDHRAELDRLRDEYLWGIIAGQRPIEDFDVFADLWHNQGGLEATAETEEFWAAQAIEYELFLENFRPR
jgi:putative aldouronate transport system substrate-binding protein